jgi:hypothetical protein
MTAISAFVVAQLGAPQFALARTSSSCALGSSPWSPYPSSAPSVLKAPLNQVDLAAHHSSFFTDHGTRDTEHPLQESRR